MAAEMDSVSISERRYVVSAESTNSIGRKILNGSLLAALPPLVFLAVAVLIGIQSLSSNASEQVAESREELSEQTVVLSSQDQAISIGREINLVLQERVRDVAGWARSTEVIAAAEAAAATAEERELSTLSIEELEAEFDTVRVLQQSGPAESFLLGELQYNNDFSQVAFTDSNGFNVSATSRPDDFVQNDEPWWQEAMTAGLSLSDVEYDSASDVFSVDVAVRIDDPLTGQAVGVIQTSLSISFVQAITTERSLENVDYTIALGDGRLIADTSSEHAQIRMMSFSFAGSAASPGVGAALSDGLEPGESSTLITDEFVYGYTSTLAEESFDIGVDGFNGFDWVIVSSQPTEVAFGPLEGLEALNDDIGRSGRNLTLIAAFMLLAGVVVATVLARRLTRQIVEPIQTLTNAASEAASTGLPTAVHQINEGDVDLEDVRPSPVQVGTNDELETLAGAFNSVQNAALDLAAEQAKSRRNTTEMFVNLGRRNQSLLKRQLRFIDSLEANEQDPDTLESLFKLDHLATRMRRNAESLLVLAGDRSPRRWAEPIDVQSAVEAALAEVENYERVDFGIIDEGKIQGNIVADVAHILAEIIENALNFSPPSVEVAVVGRNAGDRYIVSVTDEGFGMKQEEIDQFNVQLATVIEITDVPSQQLGLFVVARLARRHGIEIELSNASTGGLTVRIELPLAERREDVPKKKPSKARKNRKGKAKANTAAPAEVEAAEPDPEVQQLLAKAEAAVARSAAARSDRGKASTDDATAEQDSTGADDESADDSDAAVVEVGDFSFPRREAKGKGKPAKASDPKPAAKAKTDAKPADGHRRKTDATKPADGTAADLDAYGFTRRESKRDVPDEARRKNDRKAAPKDAEGDVIEVAEKSRSQWGSFQRGKSEAANVPVTNSDSDAGESADSADTSAGKKEK